MFWIIALLTLVLVVDCLLLILLVLIQLPKKEAGLGQAFGSATTDALFGAGSGTALTKMTKYATGVFFVITFLLAILNAHYAKNRGRGFEEQMKAAAKAMEAPAAPATISTGTAPATATTTNLLLTSRTNATPAATNLLISSATNTAPAPTNKPPAEAPK